MKRLVDVLFSFAVLAVTLPLSVLIGLAIKLTSRGPFLFVQDRVGQDERIFRMLKFRSMHVATRSIQLTVAGDDRITSVGRIMRRLKLDELPQFVNVLLGDMTLIGPRPETPRYVSRYESWMKEILCFKPGLVDPASLEFKDEPERLAESDDPEELYMTKLLPEKLRISLDYQKSRTFMTDLKVILRTISIMLGR